MSEPNNRMKYIISGLDFLLFPIYTSHADVTLPSGAKPEYAGFMSFPDMQCYGFSKSLNLKSRPIEDTNIIRAALKL